MKFKTLITFFVLFFIFPIIGKSQQIYYVSTEGNDNNDGLTESTAWRTISYATSLQSPLTPGDKVYIKAGHYTQENIVFKKNGTADNPISFEGYKNTPGDVCLLNWEYGDSYDSNEMPLIDGEDRTIGYGIELDRREYINIKNIQIINYKNGIYAYGANFIKLENVLAMNLGDINEDYSGRGIAIGSNANDNQIKNCVIYNSCAEGISVIGDRNTVFNCKVYCDDNSTGAKSAMDYYINIKGSYNNIENCYIERVGNLVHLGHGISLKGDCEYNVIKNCVAKGFGTVGFQLRHRGVKYNQLLNCIAIDCGYGIRDGASDNLIKNCKTINSKAGAVLFYDTVEDDGAQYAGRNNIFENCIFHNSSQSDVITFGHYSVPSIADYNIFVNCIFDGGRYLFKCDRENNNNKMINCIVVNVNRFYRTAWGQSEHYPLNFDFEYSVFWNNGFTTPSGIEVNTFDPRFVDIESGDYRLKPNSLCIDAGSSNINSEYDFIGTVRPQGSRVDIGVYEYEGEMSIVDKQIKLNKDQNVLIYPNPSISEIFVELNENNINLSEFNLYDMTGKNMKKHVKIVECNGKLLKLNIANLPIGTYIFQCDNLYKKIIKA